MDLSPAHCWSGPGPSATSSSTSPIGCQHLSAWQEGAPTAQSRWTDSMCGTQSGELGRRPVFTHLGLEFPAGGDSWAAGQPVAWLYSVSDTSSSVFDSLPSLCASFRSFPHVLSLQLPLPVSLTQRLFLVGAPAPSISPLLLWQWELKEKEIPSVILTQICSPSIPFFFLPLSSLHPHLSR